MRQAFEVEVHAEAGSSAAAAADAKPAHGGCVRRSLGSRRLCALAGHPPAELAAQQRWALLPPEPTRRC